MMSRDMTRHENKHKQMAKPGNIPLIHLNILVSLDACKRIKLSEGIRALHVWACYSHCFSLAKNCASLQHNMDILWECVNTPTIVTAFQPDNIHFPSRQWSIFTANNLLDKAVQLCRMPRQTKFSQPSKFSLPLWWICLLSPLKFK